MFAYLKKFAIALIAGNCLGIVSQQLSALTVDLIPTIVGAYNNATEFNPIPIPDINSYPGHSAVYQIDFSIFVYDLEPNEAGFANIGFTAVTENLTTELGGWQQYFASDSSPPILGVLFATNLDAGTPGDNIGILTSIAGGVTNPSDPRRTVGQTAPQWIGSLYLTWDGVTPAKLTTDGILFQSNSLTGQFGNTKSGVSTTIFFGVPEPSSLILLGMCAAGCFFSRGRRRAL